MSWKTLYLHMRQNHPTEYAQAVETGHIAGHVMRHMPADPELRAHVHTMAAGIEERVMHLLHEAIHAERDKHKSSI